MRVIQLYPTGNMVPRWQEVAELYRLNVRNEKPMRALWHSLHRRVVAPSARRMRIDNLGLIVDVERMEGN